MQHDYPRKRRRRFSVIASFLAACLCACTGTTDVQPADFPALDVSAEEFASSPYKHINNGGQSSDDPMPYNIDAITGATLTVEGPAVVTSIPLSIRELENRNDGLFRGTYQDDTGAFIYEGLDLRYLLQDMVEGDNGIILTDKAYRVELKNHNRSTIASFQLEEIIQASSSGRPILLAYGIGTSDGTTTAPFVFDAANENEHAEGYVDTLTNDDGCLKLVYDLGQYGDNPDYTHYANVAYVYVCEETEPGFKHNETSGEVYNSSRYQDYILSFRGSALGRELDFTAEQLEELVAYDDAGNIVEGGVGYKNQYSLANTTYWYVNEYEGLDLYKLLLYLGMDDAETMGTAQARTTLVSFIANDGVPAQESFSVDTLSYPDAFGFYEKNSADLGDGSYKPTNADLVETGYPVLLAYGVNRYPYTITKNDDGYLSGLNNSGGPMRVVFGKTQYNHANGSNQVQYLKDVIVGEDVLYNTHKYTDNASQQALAGETLSITIAGEDGQTIADRIMTVGELEDLVYGETVEANVKKAASVKDTYQVGSGGSYSSAIYEGVNLAHLLLEELALPGTNGTITFVSGDEEVTVHLDSVLRTGFHTELGRELMPILAFAKNGSPLVPSADSDGYIENVALNPLLSHEPAQYLVDNSGGPLAVLLPSSDPDNCDAISVMNLTGIKVNLVPDAYAHLQAPYDAMATQTVRFYGEGLEQEAAYSLADLEGKQTQTQTLDYSMKHDGGDLPQARYRGISVYDLFTEIGIKSNAGEVTVHSADGSSQTFSLSRLKKSYPNFAAPEKPELSAMLAYGAGQADTDSMQGVPLVASSEDNGYDAAYANSGGPLKLIIPQESTEEANAPLCVENVVGIEVSANDIDSWGHRMSDVYSEFLDDEFTFTVKNDKEEWSHVFTVDQLEMLTDLVVRDTYTVLDIGECEGLDIWKFIQRFAGDIPGIDDPIAVTVYANDGYKNDLLSVFYKEGLELGVANENGERKPLIIAYAINGCPLVDSESHEGYTGLAGNSAGPLRVIAETNQGASVKYFNKLVVTIPGSDPIVNTVDESIFAEAQTNA